MVEQWRPESEYSGEGDSVVRLTIDNRGIKRIERLPDYPQYPELKSPHLAYVVKESHALRDVTACFKYGLVQLRLPRGSQPSDHDKALLIADTPSLPRLPECNLFLSMANKGWGQLRTAELDSITGITFFYSVGKTLRDPHPRV